jgi:hypothetical protein
MQQEAQRLKKGLDEIKAVNGGQEQVRLDSPKNLLTGIKSMMSYNNKQHLINIIDSITYEELACFPVFVPWMQKTEQNYAEEQKRIAQQQAEKAEQRRIWNLPVNVLYRAYVAYINVKRCYEARKEYWSVNISDREMFQAREAIERIESELKPKLDSEISTDQVWEGADHDAQRTFPFPMNGGPLVRDFCQMHLSSLQGTLKALVPGIDRTQKDF